MATDGRGGLSQLYPGVELHAESGTLFLCGSAIRASTWEHSPWKDDAEAVLWAFRVVFQAHVPGTIRTVVIVPKR